MAIIIAHSAHSENERALCRWLAPVLAGWLLAGCRDQAPPINSDARNQATARLEQVVISPEIQQRAGVQTMAPISMDYWPETAAQGYVLDTQGLAALSGELAQASNSLAFARQEYERAKFLHDNGRNASLKTVQTAELAVKNAEIQWDGARQKLTADWGKAMLALLEKDGMAQSLASLEAVLVKLELPVATRWPARPERLSLQALDGTLALADAVSGAPLVSLQNQAPGWFYLVKTNAPHWKPGMSLSARVRLAEKPVTGLSIPGDAIVWHQAKAWAYARVNERAFSRREISGRALPTGMLVTNGITAGEEIVVQGAALLLGEELKTTNPRADKD